MADHMSISDWSSDVCSSDLRIVFPLAKGVVGKSLIRRLNAAQWLEPASDSFWNWLAPATKNKKPQATKGKRAFVTTMDDGTPVFANVELAGRKLIVEVNSAARAERAITQMGEWLGDCVSAPMAEIRTLDQVMADDAARTPQDEALRSEEEHTSELQSLMRISYAVFCLKKKKIQMTI